MVALVASFVCLPLLALQLLDGGAASSSAESVVTTDAQQPSLVLATAPASTVPVTAPETTAPETAPTEDTRPPTTIAAPTTTAPRPTTTAPPTTTTAPPPPPPPPPPPVSDGGDWDRLAQCESGGNWNMNSGNGYSGGLQFHPDTWSRNGGGEFAPMAHQASREQQIAIGERIRARQGWSAWPGCARTLGLL